MEAPLCAGSHSRMALAGGGPEDTGDVVVVLHFEKTSPIVFRKRSSIMAVSTCFVSKLRES